MSEPKTSKVKRCPYKAEPEQWVAVLHADEDGLVQCLLEQGHDGPHLMP